MWKRVAELFNRIIDAFGLRPKKGSTFERRQHSFKRFHEEIKQEKGIELSNT